MTTSMVEIVEKYNKYDTVKGVHGESASHNNEFLDLCINHDLIIMDTPLDHKKYAIHKRREKYN